MRPKIHKKNLRDDFDRIKTLDPGDGNGPGALNGGVFVVRRKRDGLVCVEKRVAPEHVAEGGLIEELVVLRRLDHPNITNYIDAFVCLDVQPPAASLYMGYCDLGSMSDLLRKYRSRNKHSTTGAANHGGGAAREGTPRRYYIPESFVWHTFHCLLKALTYLQCGAIDGRDFVPVQDWCKIIHQDIKPANVFIKTSDRGGRYPTVVLGDFGIAQTEGGPDWGLVQPCGTFRYQPPEIPEHDLAGRGDIWSVGVIIHAMCRLDDGPVGHPPPGVRLSDWERDPAARRPKRAGKCYSPQLNAVAAMALALNKNDRPTAATLLLELKELYSQARPAWKELPTWAFPK